MNRPLTILIVCAAAVAVLPRVMPLPIAYNLSALGALALLCGATIRRGWLAMFIPLGCRLFTDCWIQTKTGYGFYPSIAFDYSAYGLICLLGASLNRSSWLSVILGGLGSAATFFVVSNFGVWLLSPDHAYTRDLSGLFNCYVAAIPFAKGTLTGDIVYSLVFFGLLQMVTQPADAANTASDAPTTA